MTREEQLAFCKKCTHRKRDLSVGLLCGLTNEKANFEGECPDFKLDTTVEYLEETVVLEKTDLLASASEEKLEILKSQQNFVLGTLLSIAAGLAGAILWAMVIVATNRELGLIALAIGVVVGFTMRFFGKGIDQKFGITGAIIAVLSCLLGKGLGIIGVFSATMGLSFFDGASLLSPSLWFDTLIETLGLMNLIFFGVAAFEGYKFSFRSITKKELESI